MLPTSISFNKKKLEEKVKNMYTDVALHPQGDYHFEMGRGLALKLGYENEELELIPEKAIDSFAGVGYHFGLADIKPGEHILDLGSGSGMDAFLAAKKTGFTGQVAGIDMTDQQLTKSRKLARKNRVNNISFLKGYIERLPFSNNSFDVVISNGVFNLSAEKGDVFQEVSRVLKPGGRLVFSDIVTESHMPDNITGNPTLWAACIGGAMQQDDYFNLMESAGLKLRKFVSNRQYDFISKSAIGACKKYGVKSISIFARKLSFT